MAAPGDDMSVQVALRIRPQSAAEKIDMCHVCTSVTPGHPQVILGKDKAFTYDHVFDIESRQPDIYDNIARPLIEGCFEGYNATILAYGQTGSGKTFTMGTSFDVGIPETAIGIIPRAALHLFQGIKERRDKAESEGKPLPEIKVSAQFLELYNEEIVDLLDIESKGKKQIRVHEDHDGNIYLTGVSSKGVVSAEDCMGLLEEGAISRTTAATNMNATSSRSHAIFTIFVKHHRLAASDGTEDGDSSEEFEVLNAKFNFVDLAGSERLKRTGATGDRAREGISINQGLLSLGNVISALGDRSKKGSHVPYRDSKLTRLLQDSLGGNSRTLMIACVSPSDRDFMETLNTLKYANRARNIKNKVVVNQDKASKQIALLRQEIQQLSLELTEYKQGKRAVDGGNEYMTDTYHELEMLRTENETLRMRVKALQKNIDSQNIQLTELKVTSALAHVTSDDKVGLEDIVKKYENEIQKLSNKLLESEAMSTAAVRRAQTVSRMAMSPGNTTNEDDNIHSIINEAKQDLKREKKAKKKMKMKMKTLEENDEEEPKLNGTEKLTSPESEELSQTTEDNNSEKQQDGGEPGDESGDDVMDELEEDEEEEEEEEEELMSNTDSDDEVEEMLNKSLKDEEELQDNINDLNTDITIKQKLIDELEHSQQRLTALKHQYEQKMSLLHNKIKETEDERDKVLKNIGTVDVVAKEKSDEVRKRYEKKLQTMQKELSKLQNAKREHQRLQKTKEQNEQQLKGLRNEMNDMKKMKVKLMRQMRDEVARNKKMESKLNRQMESVLKENRKKEVELKRMKDEKKQRDLVLKRKQEELKAMRKQAKPVSGNVAARRGRPANLQLQFQQQQNSNLNETFVVDERTKQGMVTPTNKRKNIASPGRGLRSPAVSKKAKQKWEVLDRKITELTIRMKNVAQMENDMERWLADRERVSKQLEGVRKRKEGIEKNANNQDENVLRELQNQYEGLEAHLDYIQENITESQGTIMGLEEEGEGLNPNEIIKACTLSETKYLLEHFYSKSIETAQELANKDAAYKEIQIKLEAMEQHCEVQQQLLQHACNLEYGAGYMQIEEEHSNNSSSNSTGFSSTELNETSGVSIRKSRRKTALPEELLHPKDKKAKIPTEPTLSTIGDDGFAIPEPLTKTKAEPNEPAQPDKSLRLADKFQIDEKTMQKLIDLEKSLKDRKTGTGVSGSSSTRASTADTDSRGRSGSFTDDTNPVNQTLPDNFQRNTRMTKSARPFGKSASGSSIRSAGSLRKQGSSKNSPLMERKSNAEPTGQILPSKASPGKPEALTCKYTATGHSSAILSLDVQDYLMMTGSKDRTAKVWDLNTNEEIASFAQHKRDVNVVKFVPNSRLALTVSHTTVKVWDLRQQAVVKTLSGSLLQSITDATISDIGINSAGSVIYLAYGNSVKMIDMKTYSTLGKLTGHTGAVTCLLVANTGHNHDNVITGSKDHYIKIYEVVDEVASSQMPRTNLEPPHYDGVESLAMKGDVIFSGSRDNTIKKWNYANHALENHMTSAHKDWVTTLNFVPGYDVLVSGDRRGVMRLWDVKSCKQIGEVAGHGKSINAIKCNETSIFTASSDRLVRIWEPSKTLDAQLTAISS
ncbi:kinesin-like protein KIF21A isoform X3 [Clytia hemisphaerica]|uniref:Kinesin motor domain-containing protein n=1 Tax=Clytia hemisphaerica TaxID=252671 RepID=A0A7M5WWA4_9CNID